MNNRIPLAYLPAIPFAVTEGKTLLILNDRSGSLTGPTGPVLAASAVYLPQGVYRVSGVVTYDEGVGALFQWSRRFTDPAVDPVVKAVLDAVGGWMPFCIHDIAADGGRTHICFSEIIYLWAGGQDEGFALDLVTGTSALGMIERWPYNYLEPPSDAARVLAGIAPSSGLFHPDLYTSEGG